jgi:large conductance mechanosensitive channel
MLKGFRDFILRGNVVDLAVAVIIGGAFGAVVTALTNNILMQFIAAIIKKPDFSKVVFDLNGTPIQYGSFLNAVINFLIVAGVVYFFVVVPLNYLLAKVKKPEAVEAPSTKPCPECLSDVPLAAKRCKFCTSQLAA